MRKQMRRYFRKSLCGMLSAAMIAASLIVPDMTVYASPQDEAGITTQNEEDKLVEGTTGEEGSEGGQGSGSQKPGDGSEDNSGNEGDNSGNQGASSDNGGESGDSSESGDGSDEDGDEKLDGEDEKDPDGDLADDEGEEKDVIDEDLKSEDEEEEEEDDEELSISLLAVEDSGKLLQGEFNGSWDEIAAAWKLTPGPKLSDSNFKTQKIKDEYGQSLYIYKDASSDGTYIEISQTVADAGPGVYQVSLDIGGVYSQDALTLKVEADGKSLTKSLGSCNAWGNWNVGIVSGALEVSSDVTITISGTIAKGASGQVHIDNVKLNKLSYTLAELSDLLTEANKRKEGDYTTESWSKFASAKSTAQTLVTNNSTDATKITLAYANLDAAMDALVSAGMTLYYYIGESTDENPIEEVGLCFWGKNISTKAEEVSGWYGWNDSNNKTYQMTSTDYAGWYSIPLQFTSDGASAGFSVHKYDGETSTFVKEYQTDKSGDIYNQLAKSTESVCAVKGDVCYEGSTKAASIIRQVTLHIYGMDATRKVLTPYVQSNNAISKVNETTGAASPLKSETVLGQNGMYTMTKDGNWYSLTFSAPGNIEFDGTKMCTFYKVEEGAAKAEWVADFENGPSSSDWAVIDFTPVFAGKNYYYKGDFYASKEEVKKILLEMLQKLIDQAEELKQADYISGWDDFAKALAAAKDVVAKEDSTDVEIEKAYDDLQKAKKALRVKPQKAEISVDYIALTDDFITGADLSSYVALKDSGVEFKDEDGNPLSDAEFFRYLADGGTNWVRIRVWNDPYTSSGKGYGGGNNDLEKAKTLGKLATNAGMRVLIDFHYSDFWADPSKQDAPKAWKAYTVDQKVEAVYNYTLASLNELKAAGVDVGMVQVGNETNNGICGEKSTENMIKIFNAGCSAVHEFNKDCLAAIHFTNPEKGNYGSVAEKFKTVNYDVFASSYYPFWHGTTGNLTAQLAAVASKYGKKVMVAETSWVTTWDDGDGHENTAPRTSQALEYDISVQGQADEIRAVIEATNNVNEAEGVKSGSAIGVFYWEPAWISPYYVYDEDGKRDDSLYKKNQALWEQYGSGWASSYAADYDPDDAGKWYGGSAIDNQAWFDFDGTALPTAKIYSLIRTGAEADPAIATVESRLTREVVVGEQFTTYPTVKVTYNYNDDGGENEGKPHTEELKVDWDADEQKLVNTDKVGEYVVHGTVSKDGKEYKVTLTIKVVRNEKSNILNNPGFEKDGTAHTGWDVTGDAKNAVTNKMDDWKKNKRNGSYGLHFYFDSKDYPHGGVFTVSQRVTPEAGTYTFGGYIQGGGAGTEDEQLLFVKVVDQNGVQKSRKQTIFTLDGHMNWSEPELTGITVEDGESVEVGTIITSSVAGAWGSMDDFYLYGTHSVTTTECENGTVAASVLKANSGEKVGITVTPDSGYYVKTLTLSGASIADTTIINSSIKGCTAEFKAASGDAKNAVVLTYPEGTAAISENFTMPNGNVEVSATFVSVFGGAKISLNAKDGNSKYLVQVNGSDEENPIEAQWYTGKNVTPTVELSYKGYKLTSQDYSVTYTNNKNTSNDATIKLTGKGDRFEGERTITFTIKPETRRDFSKLKVTFLNPDKGDGSTPAKSTYYLGKQKELRPEIVLKDSDGKEIANPKEKPIYKVFYYNNKKLGKATVVVLPTEEGLHSYKEGSVTTTFTIAKCPINNGNVAVTISQPNQYYTGKKVEPAVSVTLKYKDSNGNEKTAALSKGTDYNITYGNNVNATKPNRLATIKITGKGNFTGTRTTYDLTNNGKPGSNKITFEIKQRSITNATITAADLVQSVKGAAPKLTVKDGTKTLASNQYVITKIVKEGETEPVFTYDQAQETKYVVPKLKDAGKYEVTVAGKSTGNYNGEKTAQFDVKDKAHLISNAKITISGKYYFTGSAINLKTTTPANETDELKVVAGSGKDTKTLTAGEDYTVTYENNINAGKATVTITGKGEYVGKKTATFTIGKRTLVAEFKNDNEKVTKGKFQTPTLSAKNIKTKMDGTWTPDSEGSETTGKLYDRDTGKTGTLSIPYTGYTLNPELTFSSDNNNGTPRGLSSSDYTVTYSVGRWVDGKAPVTATVKGKGNYSGSVKIENLFTLTARELKEFNIEVSEVSHNVGKAVKPSVTFSKKADGTVVDLKLGTAYTVTYKNNKLAAILGIAKNEPTVTVKVKGSGWITDKNDNTTTQYVKTFSIDQQEIVEANVADIAIQTYKGKALTPAVTVKVNGKKLKAGTDYTVTYSNNVKRTSDTTIGTVKITGKGNYFTRKPIEKTFIIK